MTKLLDQMLAALEATERAYDPEREELDTCCGVCTEGWPPASQTCPHHLRVAAIAATKAFLATVPR